MNEMNELNELNEMRQQMAILKDKLQEQTIVSEQQMRRAIGDKLSRFRWSIIGKRVLIILGGIYTFWFLNKMDFPIWFIIASAIFFTIALIYSIVYTYNISSRDLSKSGLIETREHLVKMRRMNTRWLFFGIPFAIAWIVAFIYLTMRTTLLADVDTNSLILGITAGGCIGTVLGVITYLKTQRKAKNLIDDIQDIDQ